MGVFDFFKNKEEQSIGEQRFYSEAKDLFDEGIITEVFKRNSYSVCNVGNAYYAVFLLGDAQKTDDLQFMIFSDEDIELVFKDTMNVQRVYESRPKNAKNLYKFNDRAHSTMRNSYKRVILNPSEASINLKTEAQLLEKYKDINEL